MITITDTEFSNRKRIVFDSSFFFDAPLVDDNIPLQLHHSFNGNEPMKQPFNVVVQPNCFVTHFTAPTPPADKTIYVFDDAVTLSISENYLQEPDCGYTIESTSPTLTWAGIKDCSHIFTSDLNISDLKFVLKSTSLADVDVCIAKLDYTITIKSGVD